MSEKTKNQEESITYSIHQGPIPDASELAKYENVQKGLADRIMAMAEKEQKFRHKKELYAISRPQFTKNLGQILGFIVAMTLIVLGTYLVYNDKDLQGLISIVLGIGSIIGAFITDRKSRIKNG